MTARAEVENEGDMSTFHRRLSMAFIFLLVFSLILTGSAAYRVATGVPDSYPNEQMRLLSNGVGLVLWATSMLAAIRGRTVPSILLLTLAMGAVVWSLSMM